MEPHTVGDAEDAGQAVALSVRASAGDAGAWGRLLMAYEVRLRRMVSFRMDRRLRGRIDAADIVQEAFLAAAACRDEYYRLPPPAPPLLRWLRGVVSNKLFEVHRRHLATDMRDANREAGVGGGKGAAGDARAGAADATSAALVEELSCGATGPGTAAARSEVKARLQEALDGMDSCDREVLAMRHFEQLSNAEAADVLGIEERAAAKRYLRALRRLRTILAGMPGGLTELRP
jgi:RNA polymerase sigma-70 factor (ECF subfamily)